MIYSDYTGDTTMLDGGRRGFLESLSQSARRELLAHARTVRVRKGQTVLARGEGSDDVYIVQEGRLHVLLYAADGREVSLRDLSDGQLFGELSALDGEARSVGIVAATDARLLAFSANVFRAAIRDDPGSADWLARRLVTQIRGLTDRVFELSALNVRARGAHSCGVGQSHRDSSRGRHPRTQGARRPEDHS